MRLRRQRLPGERLLDVGQPRRMRARAGQPDARRLDRAALHVERRRDADDRVVRRALVQLRVRPRTSPARTARR